MPFKPRYRSALAALVLLLTSSLAHAATKTWIGNAAAVPQISTITVAGTWADADTATVTINGKALVITCVGSEATTNVAIAIKEAYMAGSRLDGSGTTDATSNAGGAQFGEFAEMSATVSGSVVTLIGVTPGKPITLAVSDTAAAGSVTLATPQVATGPHHWDNAKNWDTGTVPANDDVVVFRDCDIGCYYGLPNASLEVTINQYMSFTGWIGLPAINRDNTNLPYYEYRQPYVRLDDAGTGTNIAHRFGLGKDGAGSPLINIKHSTLKCSPIIYNTGTPTIAGTKALNLCCTANSSTINMLNGSVNISSQDGSTSAFVDLAQTGGDLRSVNGLTAAAAVSISGGAALIGGSAALDQVDVAGGTLRFENQTSTITSLQIAGGTVEYASTAAITNLNVAAGGTFNAQGDVGNVTIGTTKLYVGSKFLDSFGRVGVGTSLTVYFDPSPDLQFGATPYNGITITP